jgi:hypothetical protein
LTKGTIFGSAQGRAALDKRLRSELATIDDDSLRFHAADIIRQRRARAFPDAHGDTLAAILARLRRIEDIVGVGK